MILFFAVLVEHRFVTDRQTDRQTQTQTDTGPWLYRVCIASRGNYAPLVANTSVVERKQHDINDTGISEILKHRKIT